MKNGSKIFHANMLKKYVFHNKPRLRGVLLAVVASTVVDNDVADEASVGKFLEQSVAATTNITELEQKHACELISLLNKYSDVFSDNPGNSNLVEHKIDLISDELVRVKPYPVPYSVRNENKKEVQEMLKVQ